MIINGQNVSNPISIPIPNEPAIVAGNEGIPLLQDHDDGRLYTHDLNLDKVLGSQALTDGRGNVQTKNVTNDQHSVQTIKGLNLSFPISVVGYETATVQISGTWVGTITFEANVDGSSVFYPINGFPISGNSIPITTITTNGMYSFLVNGASIIQARFSTYISGAAVVAWGVSSGDIAIISTLSQITGNQGNPVRQNPNGNELMVINEPLRILLEQVLYELKIANYIQFQLTNITPPVGYEELL